MHSFLFYPGIPVFETDTTKNKKADGEQDQDDRMKKPVPLGDLFYSFIQYPASQVKGSNEPDEYS
jgi:hypothetical protein